MIYKILNFVALKSYNIVYMGWCLTSFVFLKYERWIKVYAAVNYFGFIYMIIWACMFRGYRFLVGKESRNVESTAAVTGKQSTY